MSLYPFSFNSHMHPCTELYTHSQMQQDRQCTLNTHGPLGLASMSGARKTGWGGVSHQGIDTALFCRSNTFKCTLAQPGHTERCFPFESNQFEFYECSYITRRMKFYTRIKQIKNVDLI